MTCLCGNKLRLSGLQLQVHCMNCCCPTQASITEQTIACNFQCVSVVTCTSAKVQHENQVCKTDLHKLLRKAVLRLVQHHLHAGVLIGLLPHICAAPCCSSLFAACTVNAQSQTTTRMPQDKTGEGEGGWGAFIKARPCILCLNLHQAACCK